MTCFSAIVIGCAMQITHYQAPPKNYGLYTKFHYKIEAVIVPEDIAARHPAPKITPKKPTKRITPKPPVIAALAPELPVESNTPKRKFIDLFKFRRPGAKPSNWEKVDMRKKGFKEVKKAALKHNVEVNFALGVAAQESRGNCRATSSANAKGVMQVIPTTAKKHGVRNSRSLYNCRIGAETGVKELKYCLKLAKQIKEKALACYNAGPGWLTSRKYKGKRLPRETREYIRIITGKKINRVS